MSVHRCTPASGPLDAVVTLPGSKSITNRALVAAALADGVSILKNILLAEDTRVILDALRAVGIALTVDEAECVAEVTGCRGHIPESEAELFCGNSGTTMRFCAALVALGHGRFRLDGVQRMRQRPIGGLVSALQALGAGVEYLAADGYPPIVVHANGLGGGAVAFDSPESSQLVSGLLLAAPYAGQDVFVEVTGDLPSVPYLRMTTAIMERFGVGVLEEYAWKSGHAEIIVPPTVNPATRAEEVAARFVVEAPQRYRGTTMAIEPDASNATYFLAAPAIAGGRVTVEGLGVDSLQGDVAFVDLLERMGCRITREPARLVVAGPPQGGRLRGLDVDANDMPDTVPTLAVLALFADSPTTVRNVATLRVKETDRLTALRRELTKLGAIVEEFPDGLRVGPPARVSPATIETYDDHRMAMSFALAGLKYAGMVINDPDCCAKTMPDFFERFERMTAAGSRPARGST